MKKFIRFTKWGMRNHPGNYMYLIMVCMFGIAVCKNETFNLVLGLGAIFFILGPLYIITSYGVGKANTSLIDEEERQAKRITNK